VLIKRSKPGQPPYWTTPGGGVEEGDGSAADALHRELAEELGAVATISGRVLLISSETAEGVAVQEIFAARLVSMDATARSGAEWIAGAYAVERVPVDRIGEIDLKPLALRDFVTRNADMLLAEVFSR